MKPLIRKGERISSMAIAYSDGESVPHKRGWWVLVRKHNGEIVPVGGPFKTEIKANKCAQIFHNEYLDPLH